MLRKNLNRLPRNGNRETQVGEGLATSAIDVSALLHPRLTEKNMNLLLHKRSAKESTIYTQTNLGLNCSRHSHPSTE